MAAAFGIGLSSRFSPQSFFTFVAGRFGGSEFWRVLILLRNKRCCVAQQRGGWLRKAVSGAA